LLCDIVGEDDEPWACCPRRVLREALDALRDELGGRHRRLRRVVAYIAAAARTGAFVRGASDRSLRTVVVFSRAMSARGP
jgi:hypothetical protein